MLTNNKMNENLSSGYFFVTMLSVMAFLSFYIYNLLYFEDNQEYFVGSNSTAAYVISLFVFGVAFLALCLLMSFIPKRITEYISSKKMPIIAQLLIVSLSFIGFIFIMLNYLLVSEVENPPYAINYVTQFYWRDLPLPLVICWTGACVFLIFAYVWKNIDFNNYVVYFVYAVVIALAFMHNLYLNNFDIYHHAAAYDSVYNCYHGIPYDRFTTGIYGHYGIFIGLLLRLINGNAITMFYIHALLAALETYIYIT